MFRIFVILLLVTGSAPATADQQPSSDLMPPWCEYVSSFSQSRQLAALPVPLQSSGRMLFSCKAGLIWQTTEPIVEAIVYTKTGSNFKVGNEANVSELTDLIHGNMSNFLLAIMAGDFSALEQRFVIASQKGETVLTPKDETTARFLQTIRITKTDDGATVRLVDGRQQVTTMVMSAAAELNDLELSSCQMALGNDGPACAALLFPGQVAAGLTSRR